MTRNYVDLERELLEDLERRTGKTLAHWMAAIDAAAQPEMPLSPSDFDPELNPVLARVTVAGD